MSDQQSFLDFNAIPVVEQTQKPKVKHEWYILCQFKGEWFFLWKTHTNGGGEWEHVRELTINGGKKKPLRYKTNAGAKRAAHEHLNNDAIWEVVEWKEPQS